MIACSSGEVWRRCFCVRRKRPDTVRTCVRYVSATLACNRSVHFDTRSCVPFPTLTPTWDPRRLNYGHRRVWPPASRTRIRRGAEECRPDAPWSKSAPHVNVFQITAHLLAHASDENLKTIFADLKRRHIELGLELALLAGRDAAGNTAVGDKMFLRPWDGGVCQSNHDEIRSQQDQAERQRSAIHRDG